MKGLWRNVRYTNGLNVYGVRNRRNFEISGEQASVRKRQYLVAHENFEEQNKVLETSTMVVNYFVVIVINAYYVMW